MALPRHNRRNATVDGQLFHWNKGSRGDNGRGVVTVQLATGSGSKLMIDPYCYIADNDVRDGIVFAIERGWSPEDNGPPFWIGFADDEPHTPRFVLRKASDRPYWTNFRSKQAR